MIERARWLAEPYLPVLQGARLTPLRDLWHRAKQYLCLCAPRVLTTATFQPLHVEKLSGQRLQQWNSANAANITGQMLASKRPVLPAGKPKVFYLACLYFTAQGRC